MAPISTNVPAGGEVTVSFDPPDIENLLSLNPRVKKYANAVPSKVTKVVKKNYKRNADKAENLTACG